VEKLLFGTGGVPHSARAGSTVAGIKRIAELGLGGMEIEFVRGVKMGEDAAREVAKAAAENGVKLSVHAPYYINLNAHDPATLEASMGRILQACRIGALCGARSVVVHSAFYLGDPPEEVYQRVKEKYAEAIRQLRREDNSITIRPEIMGKGSEFGTLEEVLNLCAEVDGIAPCIDFAHLHARSGNNNSYAEFSDILNKVRERLGRPGLENLHIHFSGIKYGSKGELSHLNLEESDLVYRELLQALRDADARGLVICECPNLEEDAQLLKSTYDALVKRA
jgi:deoxyribonuclease IV